MKTYTKNYSIEWFEECEADSFEEAERILDSMAKKQYPNDSIDKSEEVEEN